MGSAASTAPAFCYKHSACPGSCTGWPSFSLASAQVQTHTELPVLISACRYHALLSSSALPGGLLDPAQLGRLRSELLASAATAAASSGVGYQDLAKESAADGSFK